MKLIQSCSIRGFKTPIVAVLVFCFFAGMLLFFRNDTGGKSFFMLVGFVASYYAYHNITKEPYALISKGLLIGLSCVMLLFLIIETRIAATSSAETDFMCFYMQGQLGVHKLPFYDPSSFNIILKEVNIHHNFTDSFKGQIFDVGLLSPPITMLFFAPLASFDYYTSSVILSLLTFVFIFVDTILLNRLFLRKERSIYSFLFIFITIMLLPATNATVGYNQSTFFILFFLLLVLYKIDKPIAGFYLALSLIIKPIAAILILYFIFNRKWKSVIYFFATGIALLFITGSIWGFHNIVDFFQSPPTQRLPQRLYEISNNFSLIGVLNRDLKEYGLSTHGINLIFTILSIILITLTYISSKKFIKTNLQLALFPFILCMLMIYPSSLECYMVFAFPILIYFLFLKNTDKYFWLMLLSALSFVRLEGFFTYLVLWISLFYVGFFVPKQIFMPKKSPSE